jgi:branched-chain amino acid transport system permease protein
MGLLVIHGFTAAVIGGFGSMPGAVVGGLVLGVIENLAPLFLPSSVRYAVPFLVLIGILVLCPAGLVGRVARRKV